MGDEFQEDAALVGLAVGGDGEAFACLYGRYKRCVWELSYYLCQRNHHDAEEAMQETFLKAWRSLSRYRGAGSFKAWLLAICRNVCIDRVHRAPARPLALERCGTDQIADRQSSGAQVEAIVLRAALAQLPPDEREAWFVVDVLGCTSQEAARIVGARAASTVRSRVNRARQQIHNALTDQPARMNADPAPPEVYGLYHSPVEKAIVVASNAPRTNGAAADPASGSTICDGCDLIGFFAGLDSDVPSDTRLVAIVDGPLAEATARWCEEHPRWELLHTPAHAAWREEAERLLGRGLPRPAPRSPSQLLARLAADEPFVWTYNRNGVVL